MMTSRKQFISTLFAVAALAAGSSLAWAAKAGETRLRAQLTGPAIGTVKPSGEAQFRASAGRSKLEIEVEHVNLAAATLLTVWSQRGATPPVQIGSITLGGAPEHEGELELNTQDGQTVPALQAGDVITVRNGAQAILSGTL